MRKNTPRNYYFSVNDDWGVLFSKLMMTGEYFLRGVHIYCDIGKITSG